MTTIKSIRAYPLEYPEPHDHGNLRYITLARIESHGGEVGWGECISQFPESARAVKTLVEDGFAPRLLSRDVLDGERLWLDLVDYVWWYGPQGLAAFAISAIDMALWDLKGKILGQPVCRLLSGLVQEKVLAMASIHLNMVDLEWSFHEFREFHEAGYRIVKGGWGSTPDAVFGMDRGRDLDLVKGVREIVGEDKEIVFDVLGGKVRWTASEAIRRVRDFEPYRLRWIEEPLPPQDYAAHHRLRQATATPIGTGEQEWNVEGYRRLLKDGAVDVVQMDPGRCHGITGSRKVIQLIEAERLEFSAHTWSSALNTAASVHLLASSRTGVAMDFKPHASPMQHELVTDPWEQEDGYLRVRQTPGLGVTVDERVVDKYKLKP